MTFKHIDFDESAIMRSFEKVGLEKGLIKIEPKQLTKKAEPTVQVTNDLFENLLCLSNNLKSRGFEKYAEAIDSKIVELKLYKKADNLYDVSSESLEDLIDFAHPDGSVEVSKAKDQNGVVETILDQHLKILEVIRKNPKISKANKQVIEQCLVAIAEDPEYQADINFAQGTLSNAANQLALKVNEAINTLQNLRFSADNIEEGVKDKLLNQLNNLKTLAEETPNLNSSLEKFTLRKVFQGRLTLKTSELIKTYKTSINTAFYAFNNYSSQKGLADNFKQLKEAVISFANVCDGLVNKLSHVIQQTEKSQGVEQKQQVQKQLTPEQEKQEYQNISEMTRLQNQIDALQKYIDSPESKSDPAKRNKALQTIKVIEKKLQDEGQKYMERING